MKSRLAFRSWYYFRMGWSTFLAIERYPELSVIFPSFPQYVLIITIIGIPVLILVGYVHYKRTLAFRSEVDVVLESNPYQLRNVVNNTINVKLTLKMYEMILKLSQNQKLTENEIEELTKSHKEIQDLDASRSFANKMDIDFAKKYVSKKN